jgi:hypothetical protein
MELPTKKVKASIVNPRRLIVYSKPKAGKTTLFANLEDYLLLDFEEGSDYVDAVKVKINSLTELREIGTKILAKGKPYKYGVVDTVTALEDMVLPLALKMYKATPIGKNFTGDNILTLPNGAGYMWLRQAFFSVIDYISTLFDYVILLGHIKDKQIDDKGEMVMAANVDLTGKIKSILCAECDAIGYLYRKGNQTFITFKTNEDVNCGARPQHLKNQDLLVAEEIDGVYNTYLDKIYK